MRTFPSQERTRKWPRSVSTHFQAPECDVSDGGHYGKWSPRLPVNSKSARRRTLVYQWKPADVPNLPVSRSYLRKTFRVGHCAISDAIFLSESGPVGIPGEMFGDLREPGRVRGHSADLHAQLLPGNQRCLVCCRTSVASADSLSCRWK